jgi:hypothetical protein
MLLAHLARAGATAVGTFVILRVMTIKMTRKMTSLTVLTAKTLIGDVGSLVAAETGTGAAAEAGDAVRDHLHKQQQQMVHLISL